MTPTPWKALDMDDRPVMPVQTQIVGYPMPPSSRYTRYAKVVGPDGAVIVSRMNRVDARHLVHCVNGEAIRMKHTKGPKLGPIIHEGGTL